MRAGNLPVQDPAFWKGRLLNVVATGQDLHKAVYDIDYSVWSSIQGKTRDVLRRYVRPGDLVLDAGCGLGVVSTLLPRGVRYVGVDVSPDLIELARVRHPDETFIIGDLRRLSFSVPKQFDWVICRSVRNMIEDNLGPEAWAEILTELRRVGKKVLLLEYGEEDLPVEVIE